MRHIDLFSGKGTFIQAARNIFPNYELLAACEIDPFAQLLLRRIVDRNIITDDVRTFQTHDFHNVDLITGGFPCQDISLARGKNARGIDGEQSGLWREMFRISSELRPLYIVIENTSTLLGRGLDTVLVNLASIRYDAVWTMLSAAQFGYPHRRKRLFITAFDTDRIGREEVQFYARTITEISREEVSRRKNIREFRRLSRPQFWRENYPVFQRMDNGYPPALNSARLHVIGNSIVAECAETILKLISRRHF